MNLEVLKNRMKARSFEFDADDGIDRPPYVLLSDVLFEIKKMEQTKTSITSKKLNNGVLAVVINWAFVIRCIGESATFTECIIAKSENEAKEILTNNYGYLKFDSCTKYDLFKPCL